MKKLWCVLIFFMFLGFSTFGNTSEQEEVDFLLFLPNSGSQFVDEEQAMIHLDNVARYLIGRNLSAGQIRIDGYTAAVPNDIDSVELSLERALFVINELQKRSVPEDLFAEPVAFGAVNIWGNNINEEARSPNRRVIIFIDGQVLTSETVDAFDPADDSSDVDEHTDPIIIPQTTTTALQVATQDEKTSLWWLWLLLLLLPLLALLLFFLLRSRKNKIIAGGAILAAPVTITYTVVNLEEEIRLCAYGHFLARDGQNGDAYGDWCKAVVDVCAIYEANGFETYPEDESWWARRESSKERKPDSKDDFS